ncbi:hypothetical protein WMO64_16970 [Pseudoflavonifractor sp. CLA-AP-H29]|uniref:Uncharacterized protein n=1 Tax=Pseudoflavonifractor intestinihominis TaxID=3133171 RepID=A0ABV1EEL4_9FIRM
MFEEKIAALNRANEQSAVCYEKRTYVKGRDIASRPIKPLRAKSQ